MTALTREIDAAVQAMRHAPELLDLLGYPSDELELRNALEERFVGSGANAYVFMSDDESLVLKVTIDPDQADHATRAKRRMLDGIVPVVEVVSIGDVPRSSGPFPAWAIVERAVVPLDMLDERLDPGSPDRLRGQARKDAQRVLDAGRWALHELETRIIERRGLSPDGDRPEKSLRHAFLWDLRRGAAWLARTSRDAGYDPFDCGGWDLNDSNVGFDPISEQLVILDLGQVPSSPIT